MQLLLLEHNEMSQDKIYLEGVRLNTIIGVYPEERNAARTIYADVEIDTDHTAAAASDDFTKAVDYAAVVKILEDTAAESSFFLLEAFAGKCVEKILQITGVEKVSVKISKPAVFPNVGNTAVKISRSN